jgi:hypothetical protein
VRSLYLLGQILEGRGQQEEAAHFYRRFLDHWGGGEIDPERVEAARTRLAAVKTAAR